MEMLKLHSTVCVASSTDHYMYIAIIWKLLNNWYVKVANKLLFTQPCRCMMSAQVAALSGTNSSSSVEMCLPR